MSPSNRRPVGVFFGGVSPEHEVSVISALQAMAALSTDRWTVVPVYIAKDGKWWSGADLRNAETFQNPFEESASLHLVQIAPGPGGLCLSRVPDRSFRGRLAAAIRPPVPNLLIEIVLPVLHGGSGENGSLQGLCETVGVAYAGSGPMPAGLAMDKVAAKRWAATFDVPQVPFEAFVESAWAGSEEAMLDRLTGTLGLPVIVKPASLGSSIGITKAGTRDELDAAVEEALRYDEVVVVEKAVTNLRELNCSVLGRRGTARPSVLEEPLSGDELLSFRDKYLSPGGTKAGPQGMASLDRKIPAAVSDEITAEISALAVRLFEAFDCQGVVRIDFLLDGDTGEYYFNEINTTPGSLAFYLWEPTGVAFPELLDEVLMLGLERHARQAGRIRSYNVNLLSEKDLGGLKGSKA
jgi:D-alanine-D-alanine ligase